MPAAKVIRAWRDGTAAYLAVEVEEGEPRGRVEYIGRVPLGDLRGLSAVATRERLIAAARLARDPGTAGVTELAGFGASVSL